MADEWADLIHRRVSDAQRTEAFLAREPQFTILQDDAVIDGIDAEDFPLL